MEYKVISESNSIIHYEVSKLSIEEFNAIRRSKSQVLGFAFTKIDIEARLKDRVRLIDHTEQIYEKIKNTPILNLHPDKLIGDHTFEMSLNVSNDTDDDLVITTDSVKYYYNGKEHTTKQPTYKLYTLRPNQLLALKLNGSNQLYI